MPSITGCTGPAWARPVDPKPIPRTPQTDSVDTVSPSATGTLVQNRASVLRDGAAWIRLAIAFAQCSGAHSSWRLELPDEIRPFDFDPISDTVMELRYTAREGGEPLRTHAVKACLAALAAAAASGSVRLFSVKREFPNAWAAFVVADTSKGRAQVRYSCGPNTARPGGRGAARRKAILEVDRAILIAQPAADARARALAREGLALGRRLGSGGLATAGGGRQSRACRRARCAPPDGGERKAPIQPQTWTEGPDRPRLHSRSHQPAGGSRQRHNQHG